MWCVCRLLDILADRKSNTRVSGSVLVNGRLREDNFRFKTGYVVQVTVQTQGMGMGCVIGNRVSGGVCGAEGIVWVWGV